MEIKKAYRFKLKPSDEQARSVKQEFVGCRINGSRNHRLFRAVGMSMLPWVLLGLLVSSTAQAGVLANIASEIQAMSPGLVYLFNLAGFVLIVVAIGMYPHMFRTGGGGMASALIALSLFVGSLLLNFTYWANIMTATVFAGDASSVNEADDILTGVTSVQEGPGEFIYFAIVVIALVGMVGLVRGVWLLRGSKSSKGHSVGHAMTMLLGSTFAINFVAFLKLLAVSAGGAYTKTFNMLFDPWI